MAVPERRCKWGFTKALEDFTLEATSCRMQIDDGSFTTSAALHARQQTLKYEWNKVGDKYFEVEDRYPEPTVDNEGPPIPDGLRKVAYLNGQVLYSDLQQRLQFSKSMQEFATIAVEPPAETNAQKAKKLIAARNKAEWTLNNRVKTTQQAVNNLKVTDILVESQQLVKELADIDKLWQKAIDLTIQIASCSEVDAAEAIKVAQQTLDTKIQPENEKLYIDI